MGGEKCHCWGAYHRDMLIPRPISLELHSTVSAYNDAFCSNFVVLERVKVLEAKITDATVVMVARIDLVDSQILLSIRAKVAADERTSERVRGQEARLFGLFLVLGQLEMSCCWVVHGCAFPCGD